MITNENRFFMINPSLCLNRCMNQCMSKFSNNAIGFIKVTNLGGYVATFAVGYTYNGTFFSKDSPNLKITQSYTIPFPAKAEGILFLAQYYRTTSEKRVITRMEFPIAGRKCFNLKGTIFNPSCVELSC